MVTMLLGGLWHGASWTFVVWGGLHGLYLLVNHAWRELSERFGWRHPARAAAVLLTFLATVLAWVFFRADTIDQAIAIVQAMAGATASHCPIAGSTSSALREGGSRSTGFASRTH